MANHTIDPDSIGIDVKKIATLANLNISREQIKKLEPQLEQILGYIEKLNEVESQNLEITRATNLKNITSDDKSQSSLTQIEAISGAKSSENGQFKVGAILSEE